MSHPFPPRPISESTIADQIALGGWKARACPVCRAPAAAWHVDDKDVVRHICSKCQAFHLTGLAAKNLGRFTLEQRRRASAAIAAMADAPTIGADLLETLARTASADDK